MFKLPQEVLDGIPQYGESLEEYVSERTTPARFKGIRVPWGFYSQRKGVAQDIYMARIRLPGGFVSGEQLKAIARASKEFGNGVPHITTRQDIQIHFVKIADTKKLMDELKAFELSPRGGGGNTVRNIMSCPYAGICSDQTFDTRGDAAALTEYLLKDVASYNLPRKYKIAFSACSKDCGYATVNDLGFIAEVRDGKRGYRVYAGGGMGGSPRVAEPFQEFIPAEDAGLVAEALKRVFFKHGNREDRHRARLRFLLGEVGMKRLKEFYNEELQKLKDEGGVTLREIQYPIPDEAEEVEVAGDEEFELFKKFNITKQKQAALYFIELRVPLGYMTADEFEQVASLGENFPGIEFMVNQKQNLLITNVKAKDLLEVYNKLKKMGLALPHASTVLDVVCCAGASTCNVGLCDSKAMSSEIIKVLENTDLDYDKLDGFNVKINGCPNSCGHHPIGFIGMNGTTRRIEGKMVPFYRILLGGRVEEGKTQLNTEVGIAPARNVPKLLKEFLTLSQGKTGSYSDAYEYLEKEGRDLMAELIEKYSTVPPYAEDKSFYRDWEKDEDFSLAGIGAAECGAGVIDIIKSDMADAEQRLSEAELEDLDSAKVKEAMYLAARALLVVRGIDAKSPEEAFDGFQKQLVDLGFCSPKFKDIQEAYNSLERKEAFDYAKELFEEVTKTRSLMDSHFNFEKRY